MGHPWPPSPIRVEGDVAYVTLSRGLESVIDADCLDIVEDRRWHAVPGKNTHYAGCSLRAGEPTIRKWLHRRIIEAPEGHCVDHINGDGLDNRKCNLRIATFAENVRNSAIRKNNTSGFKGVYWQKRDKYWQAQIRAGGKVIYLGSFATPEAAHAAYADAAKHYYGEFARV